ncbi:uncharacterized protein LOC113350592 [Papaver somniferum]|uniref:uncharacterized protein LOC113350592 n=1 Tax=Papaver somniferum TaxID=3469 RepID=UPI000E6F47A1|nr:uncharacterized protein LOC113350592 [Papaver somniferum]
MELGKVVGIPIKVDETTLRREIGYHTNVLVEVYLMKPIPSNIWVETQYGGFLQEIRIPKSPKLGKHCNVVGHLVEECRSKRKEVDKEKNVWQAKSKRVAEQRREVFCNTPKRREQPIEKEVVSQDEIVDVIIPPIIQDVECASEGNKSNSGKFHVLQGMDTGDIPPINVIFLDVSSSSFSTVQVVKVVGEDEVGISEVIKKVITVDVGGVLVFGVHAASLANDMRELWLELEKISIMNLPWLVIGDFNTVLSTEEKKGGRSPLGVAMQDFHNCINTCCLIQAPTTSLHFTWCNYRVGNKRIVCTLERALYNLKWMDTYPKWSYKVSVRGDTDHSPLLGYCTDVNKPKNISFMVLKVRLEESSFKEVIQEA